MTCGSQVAMDRVKCNGPSVGRWTQLGKESPSLCGAMLCGEREIVKKSYVGEFSEGATESDTEVRESLCKDFMLGLNS